ncbi:unnamed protein product [Urochloa humidicola]
MEVLVQEVRTGIRLCHSSGTPAADPRGRDTDALPTLSARPERQARYVSEASIPACTAVTPDLLEQQRVRRLREWFTLRFPLPCADSDGTRINFGNNVSEEDPYPTLSHSLILVSYTRDDGDH